MRTLLFLLIVFLTGNLGEAYVESSPESPDGNSSCQNQNPAPFYWSQLSLTYCDPPYNESAYCFQKMPLTLYEAEESGWIPISSDCSNLGRYAGYRYIYQNDYSIVLLYGMNGLIVGIQNNLKAVEITSCDSDIFRYKFEEVPYFTFNYFYGHDYFTLTVYFVNPETICCGGRTLPEYHEGGFGNGMWVQNGDVSTATEYIPPFRPAAVKKRWFRGNCVDAMGYHNFKDMDIWEDDYCTTMPPVDCIFDNNDRMAGFAFLVLGTASAPRYEHPESSIVKSVMNGNAAPSCVVPFIDTCGLTRMHVFFTPNPKGYLCPPGQSAH